MAEPLNTAIVESIKKDALDQSSELADGALQIALDSGVLEEIPIFKTLRGLWKTGAGIRSLIELRKVSDFLAGLSSASREDRTRFTEKLSEKGETEKFGNQILLLLDRADEIEKPRILGRIMAGHVRGELPRSIALRLCGIVNRLHVPDLQQLQDFAEPYKGDPPPVGDALNAAGLVTLAIFDAGGASGGGGLYYQSNEFGDALLPYVVES